MTAGDGDGGGISRARVLVRPVLRQRQMRRNRRSAAPTTEAMSIPAMAPPESLFPFLSVCSSFPPLGTFVAGVVGEGVVPVGAGEEGGASPGQGPRGPL
ncbi:hypothetical protein ZWY2020_037049 [Hordeum vulgare]|nr:hypothetical protein ZWY2020_037049 [Hordeum vulgare]